MKKIAQIILTSVKYEAFVAQTNQEIDILNNMIDRYNPISLDQSLKKEHLTAIYQHYKAINNAFSTRYIAYESYKQAIHIDLFQAIQQEASELNIASLLELDQLSQAITPPSSPSIATLSHLIANMELNEINNMIKVLYQLWETKSLSMLSTVYPPNDPRNDALLIFFTEHEINFLGGGNSLNYLITSGDGSVFVLKLEHHVQLPKTMVTHLRQHALRDVLTPVYVDRQGVFLDPTVDPILNPDTLDSRALVITDYCPQGDLEAHSRHQPNDTERLKSALNLYAQMTKILIDNLEKLAAWCNQEVSQDCRFVESPKEQYESYLALLKDYLDVFSKMDPTHSSTLRYAASHGYNHYINNSSHLSLDAKNESGMTALHLAAVAGYQHTVSALIARGANIEIRNNQLQLPLHSALFLPAILKPSLIMKKEAIFRILLTQAPATIANGDKYNNSSIHLMARAGFDDLLIEQVAHNPSLASLQNKELDTPIHLAILNRNMKSIPYLCAIEGVVDIKNRTGQTALHYASLYGTPEILELCCQHSHDINSRNKDGKTALTLSNKRENAAAMREILIRFGGTEKEPPRVMIN